MAFKTHKGKYKLKKPEKYQGNPADVVYRSSWERACFMWCEKNDQIVKWNAEETVIPYLDLTKAGKSYPHGKPRRYFMDLTIQFKDHSILMVEVKPSKETKKPVKRGKARGRYLQEAMTYAVNSCKWEAAAAYAKKKGWKFEIWDEKILKKKGILKW